jgi:hypothetical protein
MGLSLSREISAVGDYWQVELDGFGGASDLVLSVTVTDPALATVSRQIQLGPVDKNEPPICENITPVQDFINSESGDSIALIDINNCQDPEADQFSLQDNLLDITMDGDYQQTVLAIDQYGAQSQYTFSGTITPRDLTGEQFAAALIDNPSAIAADSCFEPVNRLYDELVICDYSGDWLGIQYNSTVDTSGFSNVALSGSAQGFINLSPGNSLDTILGSFSRPPLPNNQAVSNPGRSDIVITASIDRDPLGVFSNFSLSATGFVLEGSATESSQVSCDGGRYILPVSAISGERSSIHTINRDFVETIAVSTRITDCVATNLANQQTLLEGDIDIAVNQLSNENPVINSVSGINPGFEGSRTVVAEVTDVDNNIDTVSLRYRGAGTLDAWTEVSLVNAVLVDQYQAVINFNYQTNLAESGSIEYQVVASDSFGGQATSNLLTVIFDANEITAQAIIEEEITADPLKIEVCFDCTFIDATGNLLGPFDALFNDAGGNNYVYEYNAEGRTATEMTALANSLAIIGYSFYEIPISPIVDLRTNIRAN